MVLAALAMFFALAPLRLGAEISPTVGRDLLAPEIYKSMQNWMLEKRFDGWIFTGQGMFDDVEAEFLGLEGKTRHRWFIFYGGMGTLRQPFLIYHPDDEPVFAGYKFYPTTYRSYAELKQALTDRVFTVARDIAINASPKMEISEISQIDIGAVELLQDLGLKLRPAGTILSFYDTRWTVEEVESHKDAAARLDSILPVALDRLREKLGRGKKITDYELAQHIEKNLRKLDLEITRPVVVAVGSRTLLEGYVPDKKDRVEIPRDSLIYIEVSARRRGKPEAMHARLGWTVVAADSIDAGMQAAWDNIVAAADTAVALLSDRIRSSKPLTGREVDEAARPLLGRDPNVLPRPLGYNLNRRNREFGVRFDNYLNIDNRDILPGMGFTLEPGIYGKSYAMRICTDIFLEGSREVTLSAPLQRRLIPALGDPAQVVEAFLPPME
jgi:Xaa-Pro aminopeptidase